MGRRLGESQDLPAELWIVELGRPPLLVCLNPQPLAGRIKLLEVDPASPAEAHDLNGRIAVLRDDHAFPVWVRNGREAGASLRAHFLERE